MNSNAQNDSTRLAGLIQKLKQVSAEQPLEKVYIHFDKPYYAVADTIWLKAYLTTAHTIPSALSKIVYVELFTSKDSLVKTLKLPVKNSVAYGNIPLGIKDFKQGNYYIRAYTTWMLNFAEDYLFFKNIPIGEAIDKELNTNLSLNHIYEAQNKAVKTTATLIFKDLNKKLLSQKSVNWVITQNGDEILKGRGTTDAKGQIQINLSRKEDQLLKNGKLSTTLQISPTETASSVFNLTQHLADHDFQFFPEGGEFILGIPNQIGVKATASSGYGIEFKGSIVSDDQTEISPINYGTSGMGSFYINPEIGKNYSAKITYKDGTVKLYPLPKAKESGITLQVANQTPEMIQVKILASPAFLSANQGKIFHIIGQSNESVLYAASTKLLNQLITIRVPRSELPNGIIQFTLFDELTLPISERLVFHLHPSQLNLQIKSNLASYKPRQEVKLNIISSKDNQPVKGDFSVTVIDMQKVPYDEIKEASILSYLLLSSDLKGYIENPNYYFTKTDEKKLADLDKLMLTQGYRRFSYADLISNKVNPIRFLPEQGINLSGTLRDRTGMPIRRGNLRLTVTDKPISAELVTQNNGSFNFQNLVFPDSSEVVINARYNPNPNNIMIVMDGFPIPVAGKNKLKLDEIVNIDTALSAYLNNSQKQYRFMRTLKEVEIKGTPAKRPTHNDHGNLTGLRQNPDHFIEGSNFTDCVSTLECLKTKLMGVTFDNMKLYNTRLYNSGNRTPMQVYLNNLPVEADYINNINPMEIDNIEIFLTDPMGIIDNMHKTKGVIIINTKKQPAGQKISKSELLDMLPKNYMVTLYPQGYSKEREFYSPKYLPNAPFGASDLRSTLYWNPKVITNEKGEFNLSYFNADGKGNMLVIVEGFDKEGNLARGMYQYKVN
ncbi:MAG: carboxypeptidase regulatory-like domain-containing protein [Pedobacter sp.]|nr:MAG: carboxypeptidase regulatory-like domain-containing protein [Pedobacter sp.]